MPRRFVFQLFNIFGKDALEYVHFYVQYSKEFKAETHFEIRSDLEEVQHNVPDTWDRGSTHVLLDHN